MTRVCVRSGSVAGTSPSGRDSFSESWEGLLATGVNDVKLVIELHNLLFQ